MTKTKPLILVTNDDGITAPGIRMLIDIMKELGDVVVVAPDSPQSGMGHAITLSNTIFCDEVTVKENMKHKEYSCSGTPADCVKIATQEIMERKPDLVVSGINHGANSSINVIYSGTMSAAVEAGVEGLPAIGFSLLDYSMNADFEPSREYVKTITRQVLKNGLPKGVVLNVNIPKLKASKIKGMKVCRQAKAHWEEEFDRRTNPQGRDYFWAKGKFVSEDSNEDNDEYALANGYISIVPVQFDMTAHHYLQELESWKFQ